MLGMSVYITRRKREIGFEKNFNASTYFSGI